ncbi:MAG TPA: hypothetical protein VD966_07220, partial [Pyrinomonadaceae bacterium]|nr:hypothetical protein [Pyrinomonadaceae bacterium]
RRLTKDVLGRLVKVEEMNWDGSIYSTATYGYNARDQLTSIAHNSSTSTLLGVANSGFEL